MGDRFATINMGRLRCLRTQACLRPCNNYTMVSYTCLTTSQKIQPMHNKLKHAQKSWEGCCAPFRGRCWVPIYHNAAWADAYGLPPYQVSGIIIHPAVWPQRTWAENWDAVPLWGSCVPSSTMWPGSPWQVSS